MQLQPFFKTLDIQVLDPALKMNPNFMMPEAAVFHLIDRLLFAPALCHDAVSRTHRSGPVGAMKAVDQHRGFCGIRSDLQKANELCVARSPGFKSNPFVTQAGPSNQVTIRVISPQADHRLDSQLFKRPHPLPLGLFAPIQLRGNTIEVSHSRSFDFCRPLLRTIRQSGMPCTTT